MKRLSLAMVTLLACAGAQAASEKVEMNLVTAQGVGQSIGNTGKHEGPEGQGHLGDLPVLVVNNDGIASEPVTAPRLKSLDEVKDKALMIHVGGDNMSDQPKPLGGGCASVSQIRCSSCSVTASGRCCTPRSLITSRSRDIQISRTRESGSERDSQARSCHTTCEQFSSTTPQRNNHRRASAS